MKRHYLIFACCLLFPLFNGSAAAFDANQWSKDCVGYFQISLPSGADVAATSFKQMLQPSNYYYSEFDDGESASYSKYEYAGVLQISRRMSDAEEEIYLQEIRKTRSGAVELNERYRKLDGQAGEARYEEFKAPVGEGWAVRNGQDAYVGRVIQKHAFSWNATDPEGTEKSLSALMERMLAEVEYRSNFSLPTRTGLCAPYLFIPTREGDGGAHTIATTYRLKAHPDVTILLEDATAFPIERGQDPAKFTAVSRSNFFWTQNYTDYVSISNLMTLRRHNTISFAGTKGVESMVRMIRKDKVTEDFGYLVMTDGDPKAGNEKPELMLYVIRDAKNAEKRGMQPIGKDEFFKLAREIAASVKRRAMP
ncbi:T6SS immunity protein Tli4 family protein [Herbaspirillum huttiense]|uniref:T6SS immunity protein Tli4 family protein n=1 Tax=Herbaspirillum huttiense TaxID=863372 RepID=UPI003824D4A1